MFTRPPLDVFHSVESIAASRGGAYRFLDDNRDKLLHSSQRRPRGQRIVRANKLARDGELPEQIIVQYIWREESCSKGAVRPLRRRTHHDAVRRHPGARRERQPDPLGAQARQRRPRRQRRRSSRNRKTGASGARNCSTRSRRASPPGSIGETIGGELGMIERASPPFGVQQVDGIDPLRTARRIFRIGGDRARRRHGRPQWQISFWSVCSTSASATASIAAFPKAHRSGRDFHILIDCGTLSCTDYLSDGDGETETAAAARSTASATSICWWSPTSTRTT